MLGIRSWFCHINPREETAFSCTAQTAEEASCHSSVTMWSLYSLHPLREMSALPFNLLSWGGNRAHWEDRAETPPLTEECWTRRRYCLLLCRLWVACSEEQEACISLTSKEWAARMEARQSLCCGTCVEVWKLTVEKSLCAKMPVSAIQLHQTYLHEADKQQASVPVFFHYLLVSSSLHIFISVLSKYGLKCIYFGIIFGINPEQTPDCFISWSCSEIIAWEPSMLCFSQNMILR